jgi:hypothetical protein
MRTFPQEHPDLSANRCSSTPKKLIILINFFKELPNLAKKRGVIIQLPVPED